MASYKRIPFLDVEQPNYLSVGSGDIDLKECNKFLLSPTSKLVYKQWELDFDNDKLIDGYFRCSYKAKNTTYQLPFDIKHIIKSYYTKKYSKPKLKQLSEQKARDIQKKKRQRNQMIESLKETCLVICLKFVVILVVVIFIGLLVGTDIAGLIINENNDCNLTINNGYNGSKYVDFSVYQFLLIGCVSHICYIVIAFSTISVWTKRGDYVDIDDDEERHHYEKVTHRVGGVLCCMSMFTLSWSIIGFLLYSEMDNHNGSNKKCMDMVISWSVILVFESGVLTPFILVFWMVFAYLLVTPP